MSEPGGATQPVFELLDGQLVATELASGPWDPNAQIGGAAAALLAREFERHAAPDRLIFSRLTYEFIRPAPIGPVEVRTAAIRDGRRVQLVEGVMAADGVEVVKARALRVHRASAPAPVADGGPPPPLGSRAASTDQLPGLHRPRFATDANEIRFVAGGFGGGPGTAWFRLVCPLVAGEEPTPIQRLAAAADFGAGLSGTLPRERYVFINVDLTVYVEREPVGEWVCLESATRIAGGGVGVAESILYDQRGRVGRATQALLIAPR